MRGPLTSPSSLDRAYRALVRTMAEARTAPTEHDLLHRVCQVAVTELGFVMAWVGVAEHDERRSVRAVAQAGFEAGYLALANISWADEERGRGPAGTSIREGRPVVCRTIAHDPAFAPWSSEAKARQYASVAVLPLMVDGNAWGALILYCDDEGAFADDEMALLEEMSEELAFNIEHRRSVARHAGLSDQLKGGSGPDSMAVTAAQTAHDLNNLLAVIALSATMLKESMAPGEVADLADDIADAAARATTLSRHLLAASRRQVIAVGGPMGLDGFLRDLTPILKRLAGTVAIVVEAGAPDALVAIGRTALEQIAINLVVNARDAMGGTGVARVQTSIVEVPVATERLAKGFYARLCVGDTGAGIAPELLGRVFEPFFTTKGSQGSGLGLACVADQVRQARGSVDIESTSAGTTVTVCLPLA
jgi:signal transduction histidine kinase